MTIKTISFIIIFIHIVFSFYFLLSYSVLSSNMEFVLLMCLILIASLKIDYIIYFLFFLIPFIGNNPGNDFLPLLIILCLISGIKGLSYLIKHFRKILSNHCNISFIIFLSIILILSLRFLDIASIVQKSHLGLLFLPGHILFAQENSQLYPINNFVLFYSIGCLYLFCIYLMSKYDIQNILKFFIIYSGIFILIGIIQYFIGIDIPLFYPSIYSYRNIPRMSGFFANPGWFSQFLFFILFISIYFGFNSKFRREKIIFFIFSLFTLLAILLSLTRAAYTALFFLAFILFTAYLFKKVKKMKLSFQIITIISIFILFSISVYFIISKPVIYNYFTSNPRIYLYNYAIQIFLENPIYGSGIGSFSLASRNLFTGDTPAIIRYFHSTAHNLYLNLLAEGGIILFAAFFYMMISGLLKKTDYIIIKYIKLCIFSLLLLGFFQYLFYIPIIAVLFFFFLSILSNYGEKYE